MKEGDKLICRKKKSFFSKDKNKNYTDGKIYQIENYNKSAPVEYFLENSITGEIEHAFTMPKICTLYITDDKGYDHFLELENMNIFITESELRKLKLKKIRLNEKG